MTDWKNDHANASGKALEHPLVDGVIAELLDNLNLPAKGLPAYGIHKVAMYAAQVARAQALGFDPELLRSTPAEATEHQLQLAQMAVSRGIPVQFVLTAPNITVTREELAETLRVGGIAYHREHDKEWRDNPWKDGISVDLDGPALDYLVEYIVTHAEHNCAEHDEEI